jgi:amylosucrase
MARLDPDSTADLEAAAAAADAELGGEDLSFRRRLDEVLPVLHGLFTRLYGSREDGREAFAAVVAAAAASWRDRPGDLKELDAQRDANPDWYLSERMLGGVCYVDRYAGTLAGIRRDDGIPVRRGGRRRIA